MNFNYTTMETKHTKGTFLDGTIGWKIADRMTNGTAGYEIHWSDDGECITDHVYTLSDTKLIAEAGTVASETGKTPRQLADINKELLEALKLMIETCNPTDVVLNKTAMGIKLGEYYVGSKGIPSDESIHKAINAIKKATE